MVLFLFHVIVWPPGLHSRAIKLSHIFNPNLCIICIPIILGCLNERKGFSSISSNLFGCRLMPNLQFNDFNGMMYIWYGGIVNVFLVTKCICSPSTCFPTNDIPIWAKISCSELLFFIDVSLGGWVMINFDGASDHIELQNAMWHTKQYHRSCWPVIVRWNVNA